MLNPSENIRVQKLLEHGSCFVCGRSNPQSIGVEWQLLPDGHIESTFIFNSHQQGPPGFVHGGASAAVLDEAMGLSIWNCGYRAVTVNLNINYRKPVPLGKPVQIRAHMNSKNNRRVFAQGEILLPDGTIAVSASGIYVESPGFLDKNFDPVLEPSQ